VKNFFRGFREILEEGPNKHIKEFEKCDFTNIYMWDLAKREKKKDIPNDQKKREKAEREAAEEQNTWVGPPPGSWHGIYFTGRIRLSKPVSLTTRAPVCSPLSPMKTVCSLLLPSKRAPLLPIKGAPHVPIEAAATHDTRSPEHATLFAVRALALGDDRRAAGAGGQLPRGAPGAVPRQGLTLVHVRAQLEQLQNTFMS